MKKFEPDPRIIEARKQFSWRLTEYQEAELRKELRLTEAETEELFIQIECQMDAIDDVENRQTEYKKLLEEIHDDAKRLKNKIKRLNKGDMTLLDCRLLEHVDGLPVLTIEETLDRQKEAKIIEQQKKKLKGDELKQFELDEYLKGKAHKLQALNTLAVLDTIQKEMNCNIKLYSKYTKWSLQIEGLAKAYGYICLHDSNGIPINERCISGDEKSLFILMCRIILNEKDEKEGVSIGALSKATKRSQWYQRNHPKWVEQNRRSKEKRQKSGK
jgi:hypothetical protein